MIKAIIVDMDGTFLDEEKNYDKERFLIQYEEMKARDIKFVVASGNQYQRLRQLFPEIYQELGYVADNGAQVLMGDRTLARFPLSEQVVPEILSKLASEALYAGASFSFCCEERAYVYRQMAQPFLEKVHRQYPNYRLIDDYSEVQEPILKLAFNFPEENVLACEKLLNQQFQGQIKAMTSGFVAIDVVAPMVNKATGIKCLLNEWQIDPADVAAFGDNLNDLEMLKLAGHSFGMANGRPEIKAVADTIIGTNEEQAVLTAIDELLQEDTVNMLR